MAELFQIIGRNHGATQEQVRQALGQRNANLDLAIILSFVAFYAWAANLIVRPLCRRCKETSGWVVMIAYTSTIASAIGTLLAERWIIAALRNRKFFSIGPDGGSNCGAQRRQDS